jgi:hypothetical protein
MSDEIKTINPFTDIPLAALPVASQQNQGGTFLSDLRSFNVGEGGSNVFRADKQGVWLGAETFAAAPFRVSMGGAVYASDFTLLGGSIKYGKTSFTDTTHDGYYFGSEGIYAGKIADATLLKFTIADGSLQITGKITAGAGSDLPAGYITGSITADQIGSITAAQITGTITASQIGSVNAGVINGLIQAEQIQAVNATTISGAIVASQIGSVNASVINGVIVTEQLADQIINDLALFATDLRPIKQVSSLPALPHYNYPVGATVYLTTDQKLYRNAAGVWSASAAASDITGQLTASQIGSINSSAITGLILAGQINSIAAGQITGQLSASQIYSVNASAITGTITASQISSVNASAINGSITAGQINSITAGQITGQITGSQIANLAITADKIANSTITASQIASLTITASQISNLTITGGKIANSSITYDKLSVTELSAVTANMGTITAGTFRVSTRINIQKSDGTAVAYLGQDPNSAGIWGFIAERGYGLMCRYSGSNYFRIYMDAASSDAVIDMPSPNRIKIQDNEGNAIARFYGRNAGVSNLGCLDMFAPIRLYTASTPPTGATDGMIFYHTTYDEVWVYRSGAWKALEYVP